MSEEKVLPAIMINSQYIKDLSLEIPLAPQIFKEMGNPPSIEINVSTKADKLEDNNYNVFLSFEINGEVNKQKLFILELVYACMAQLNVPQEHIEPVLMVEIPRLLFPFARSIITNSLVDAGLPPFMVNPIDFAAMYQSKKSRSTVN